MPKLPVVSGNRFAAMLQKLGYSFVRQKGSHMIYHYKSGHITVPKHRELDPGLFRGMVKTVSAQTGLTPEELIDMLFQ